MIEIPSRDGKLVFKDYNNREITILHEDYLELMASVSRQEIRPALEECLSSPSEVWWVVETIDDKEYSYYKYIKLYSNLVFVAYVLHDDLANFRLNNFYGYAEDSFHKAENERTGQLIKSDLR